MRLFQDSQSHRCTISIHYNVRDFYRKDFCFLRVSNFYMLIEFLIVVKLKTHNYFLFESMYL